MRKAGIITGAIIGAIGLAGAGIALSDGRIRRKIYRKSRKMLDKAGDAIEGFTMKH